MKRMAGGSSTRLARPGSPLAGSRMSPSVSGGPLNDGTPLETPCQSIEKEISVDSCAAALEARTAEVRISRERREGAEVRMARTRC